MKMIFVVSLFLSASAVHALDLEPTFQRKLKGSFKSKIQLALENLETVLASPEFYERVASIKSYTCMDSHSNGVTLARQVAPYLKKAKISFSLRSYWGWSAVAATEGSVISLNKRYKKNSVNAWSNTLIHEILHAGGFGHCGLNDISRYPHILEAVPYKVGDVVEEMLDELEED
ncbi:MAG: hypothetical protein JNM93_14160 [Bacteriovoracaceae bacterium]|nr:hypothetical protein [Bacteriovoracaceae bacterium]